MYRLQTKRVGLAAFGCVLALTAWPLRAQDVKDQDIKEDAVLTTPASTPGKVNVSVTEDEARANPPTFKVRMEVLWKQMRGFQAFYETVPGTIFDHARNFPSDWGRGFPGLGKRFANQYGQFLVSEVFEAGVAAVHREDPRYFYSKDKKIWPRVRHALVMTVMNETSDGSGRRRIAISRFAGVYGSWAVAQQWSPGSVQDFRNFILWGSVGMAFKAGSNVAKEFWPDIRHKYFPKRDQRERERMQPAAPIPPPKPAPEKEAFAKPVTPLSPGFALWPESRTFSGEVSFESGVALDSLVR